MSKNYARRIEVLKKSGRNEPFSKAKLVKSLKHTCLPHTSCKAIADHVSWHMPHKISTKKIYRKTTSLIKKKSLIAAAQYSLKQALFELGPDGHYFENFVSRYFEALNFTTLERVIVQGRFVKHEIDVIAHKDKLKCFVECKFHNHQGIKNDIKMALYVKARWDDLKQGPNGKSITHFYLASNTAFTTDALTYAKGTGLILLGINAPSERSFLDEIRALKLYPITSISSVPKIYKRLLLANNIILAKDILQNDKLISSIIKDESLIQKIVTEVQHLLGDII